MRSKILSSCLAALPALAVAAYAVPADAACKNLWCQQSAEWKDGGFGASYSFWTGIETKADHSNDPAFDPAYLKAGGELNVTAKVLGKRQTIADVSAIAYNNAEETYGAVSVVALGQVLAEYGMEKGATYGFDRTFFKADDKIKVLGVKVKLKGKATGALGVDVNPSLQDGAIVLDVRPFTYAYASVDASVGASCASVGVSGSATAIELEVPSSASASVQPNGIGYAVASDYDLQAINGKIKVKVKVCGTKKTKTIASFGGARSSGTLLNTSGTLSL